MSASVLVLAFVTAQRVAELLIARRNTRALLARRGVEYAPGHYPLIVAVHAAWLAGLLLLAPGRPVELSWLCVFAALQVARLWVLATLKGRWTTRIIVLPGVQPVRTGPYRYCNHPNYAVVIGEIAVLPLAFGLPWFAVAFTLLNGAVLAIRIRAEGAALAQAASVRP